MAAYEFRCEDDGAWEELWPIGTAPDLPPCPRCGRPGRRAITAPRLALASRVRMSVIDATEASADAPAVVTALPRASLPRRARVTGPAQRLPRP